MKVYLGIDVGSVSTNVVSVDTGGRVVTSAYLETKGRPILAVQEGLGRARAELGGAVVAGLGATGSGRRLAAVVAGADVVKNEITAHAFAALHLVPGVKTVLEIGGQDSKLIIIRDGVVVDFAMNTVCAAGTGSFLDRQAHRLGIPIAEFGRLALCSQSPVRIAGRCAVFAESDMIHKQQMGYSLADITHGLCQALVRNYLNNVGKGKEILPPVVFQGGVAANAGIRRAFAEALNLEVSVPEHHGVMGAIGSALLAREADLGRTAFRGFDGALRTFRTGGFACEHCGNACEVMEVFCGDELAARWGDRCGRWSTESRPLAGS
ncbi:MAG: acyl-CoA dehydratase activase [Bacillota bacterium]